tara:strand:+ start:100 stop:1140 length:1041 start_codon:yes stop_codon:yes gene_type:complete
LQKFHSLKILKIKAETTSSVSISFEVPDNLKNYYLYKAGQYVTLKAKIKGDSILRSYSICSSPKSGRLTVAIKSIERGLFSNYANEALREGDVMDVSKPEGRFVFQGDDSQEALFGIAAGSGITPLMSIVKDALVVNDKNKFVLLYGNKNIGDSMFHFEIKDLKLNYPNRFFCYNIYSRENNEGNKFGRIDGSFLKYCLNQHSDLSFKNFFLCGPEELTVSMCNELEALGFDKSKILFELFYSKNKIEVEKSSEKAKVKITSDYEDFEISVSKNMTLLDAALNEKIDVPYSCQGGVCSSCIGKVTKGTVKMIQNNILSDQEIEEGLTLACQAIPTSDFLSIDFDDV